MPPELAAPPPPAPAPSAPDWSAIPHDVLCPLCDYNLRGLSEPRCPECGHRFNWPDVTDPSRRVHPWLFEHHPERNVWSFFRTLIGGLRPGKFWSSVSPTQPPKIHRLRLYALVCAPLCFTGLLSAFVFGTLNFYRWYVTPQMNFGWAAPLPGANMTPTQILRESAGRAWTSHMYVDVVFWATLFLLILPFATYAALMIFRISMRKARVKPVHVVRCVTYAADSVAPYSIITTVVALVSIWAIPDVTSEPIFTIAQISSITSLAVLLHFTWRLCQAYRKYLRFDHAIATVIAAEVVAVLAISSLAAIWNDKRIW